MNSKCKTISGWNYTKITSTRSVLIWHHLWEDIKGGSTANNNTIYLWNNYTKIGSWKGTDQLRNTIFILLPSPYSTYRSTSNTQFLHIISALQTNHTQHNKTPINIRAKSIFSPFIFLFSAIKLNLFQIMKNKQSIYKT